MRDCTSFSRCWFAGISAKVPRMMRHLRGFFGSFDLGIGLFCTNFAAFTDQLVYRQSDRLDGPSRALFAFFHADVGWTPKKQTMHRSEELGPNQFRLIRSVSVCLSLSLSPCVYFIVMQVVPFTFFFVFRLLLMRKSTANMISLTQFSFLWSFNPNWNLNILKLTLIEHLFICKNIETLVCSLIIS